MARIPSVDKKVSGAKASAGSTSAAKPRKSAGQTATVAAGPAKGASPKTAAVKAASEGASSRRPGRPPGAARGAEQRNRLLDAALVLFARQGIVDTTLGEIAREAGFTPAMMHYYFKTRDQLLDVLIDERFGPLRASLGVPFQEHADDPVAAITQLAERMVQAAVERPWFPSLWVREVISDSGLLRQRMQERSGDANQKTSLATIERWQKEGRLNPALEPSLMFVTLLGLTLLPLATSKLWRRDPKRRLIGGDEIARHAVALLVQGINPKKPG
ncbi:HTH-type transcriptional regulator BetI [Paraburkholderia kirstenboschensis]|uniref:TetR/AcrR family transcriptional regulator n=1 Tax=Paraburkholderia kirstenboschensis TaxID=1245436 RepID=UPI000A5F924A|nr:TetR/AcrR family transcriptional regulator [Paraburkholderia kirstenboschensis]CAD6550014.1 HTH-type transcriptional regulator BetI [Paraburkholderia kirstenboschensis]